MRGLWNTVKNFLYSKNNLCFLCIVVTILSFICWFNTYTLYNEQSQQMQHLEDLLEVREDVVIQLNNSLEEKENYICELEKELNELREHNNRLVVVRVTHYSSEETGSNMTASGKIASQNRTLACNFLPFGTHVKINGKEYIVEDTGDMEGDWVDIYVGSTQEALSLGSYNAVMEILE